MPWQYTPYIPLALVTAGIAATLAYYIWKRRPTPGAMPLMLLLVAAAEWSLAYALEFASIDLATKIFWAQVQYFGIIMVPVLWLAFVLQYTMRPTWLKPRNFTLLMTLPLVTLLLVWTNRAHGLIWSHTGLDTSGAFLALNVTYGTWFWVHTAYAYLLWLVGTLLLIPVFLHQVDLYRVQVGIILVGALFPFIGNVVYLTGLSLFPQLDLTPFTFVISAFAAVWALLRFPLLDIMHVTRRAVIDSLSDVLIVLDAQHRVADLNPAAQPIITFPLQEAIGQPVARVFSDHADLIKLCSDVPAANNEITLLIEEVQHHYDARISPLNGQSGRLIGWSVILRDITERKRAEEALRTSEAKFRNLVENSKDGISLIDEEGIVVEWNHAQEEITGLSRDEVLGHKIVDIDYMMSTSEAQSSFDYEQRSLMISNVLSSGPSVPLGIAIERDIQLPDGSQKTIEATAFTIKTPTGYKLGSITRDITDRKQVEVQLLHQANILRNIFDAMIVTDLNFKIESWNRAAELMYGWRADEVIGKGTQEVLQTKLPAHQREEQIAQLFNQGYWQGEAIQQRKDGTAVNVRASISLIKDSAGQLTGVVAINRDITERKLAEQALKKHQEHLEELVAERTAKLTIANAELAQALQAKDEFVANMSHELRTPLSIITFLGGNLDTLYYDLNDTDRLEMIRDIRRHTQMLNELIGNVLEISRLTGGRTSPQFRPVNLVQLIREEVHKYMPLVKQKSQTLNVIGDEQLAVSGDDGQLRLVIRNLLNNAIKYTPINQQITFEYKVLPQSQSQKKEEGWPGSGELSPGYWAALRVVDTGHGIDSGDLPHLFDRFFRVNNQGNIPGTGLGLSIARELIELHGGRIAVASAPGQGSIFSIYLPLIEGAE